MGNGGTSVYLLAFIVSLLLGVPAVDSQGMPDISDMIIEFSYTDEYPVHSRGKRDANSLPLEYIVVVEVNVSQLILIEQIKSTLDSISLPLQVDNTTEIDGLNLTTVCQPNGTLYQCVCEDQYAWSYDYCATYKACDPVTTGTCGCIGGIPTDGQMCVPKNELPLVDFMVEIEMNTTSTAVIEEIRSLLSGFSFPLPFDNLTDVTAMNLTTVCLSNNTGYQCRCEEQYFWPCSQCTAYGHCDDIINATCGCINGMPSDGQFCHPVTELTETACATPPPPTVAPVLTVFRVETEIDTMDAAVIDLLRELLKNLSFPLVNSDMTQITEVNITTVCLSNNTGYQCRCEDQYFWPCNKCVAYGNCDVITDNTCGCISGLPNDGQFCQPSNELTNITTCLIPTTVPPVPTEYMVEIEIDTLDAAVLNQLRILQQNLSLPFEKSDFQITELNITTVCLLNNTAYQCRCENQYFWPCDTCIHYGYCDMISGSTCGCINDIPNDGQFCRPLTELTNTTTCLIPTTVPPVPTEYMVEIEIDTLDAAVLNQLRILQQNLSLPFGISDFQITELNITTVCLLNNTAYQCRCENQYFWPCDTCIHYGYCDMISGSTCGCINDIPNDGQFCRPLTELTNTTTCLIPTTVPPVPTEYMVEIEIDTLDAAVLNQLRILQQNLSLPFGISDFQITELNITTVCLLNNTAYQCRCENQYFWPCDTCIHYGYCDMISGSTCGCINDIPNDGQFCRPLTELTNTTPCLIPTTVPPVPTEYMVEIEIDTLDAAVLNQLRILQQNLSLPFGISDFQITELNITTVCLLNNTGYQCRCEDQYFWPCNKCTEYGTCDVITDNTCGCISGLPNDGQFCQPITELINNTVCPTPTPDVDECAYSPSVCGLNANCTNTFGSYICTCLNGYNVTNSNQSISISNPCTDMDECTETPEVCGPNANCSNSNGSYSCTCLNGYNVTNLNQSISISNPCTGTFNNQYAVYMFTTDVGMVE
ncbi:uncharacterized protein LOC125780475 [Astyanax mexicanus]|uniref:uncharacterized protein LOC125780475 n=1 Tax=Astyanax mexicanus TaxID=7994 RepID=UPI0020CABEA5|nr:uncharacterized protein LOC125780475 [Astyanax mexicanus]